MNTIRHYADFDLRGSLIYGKQVSQFPASPRVNEQVLKDGVLWIWATIEGLNTWYPLTNKKMSYVHTQGAPAASWTINHGFDSTNFVFAVYDENGAMVNPSGISSVQNNSFVVDFGGEPSLGRVVVFFESEMFTPALTTAAINAETLNIANGTVTAGPTGLFVNGIPVSVAGHVHAISDVTGLQGALDAKADTSSLATVATSGSYEDLSNKPKLSDLGGVPSNTVGQANGVASLDSNGLIPSAQIPGGVDEVQEYPDFASLPVVGQDATIYITTDTDPVKQWRWSGSAYAEMVASPGSTDAVPEGSINLYHTTLRAAAAAPVQTVAGRVGSITLTSSDIGGLTSSATTANASINTVSTLVLRDGSGNFAAGTITASLAGNATTATTATNIAGGVAGSIVYQTAAGTTALLAPGSNTQVLTLVGGLPAWAVGGSGISGSNISYVDGTATLSMGVAGGGVFNTPVQAAASYPMFFGPSAASGGNITGGKATIRGAAATGTGIGGAVDILGGAGGPTSGAGGGINITTGTAATSGAGGALALSTGTGQVSSSGGAFDLTTGNGGSTSGNGGAIAIISGSANSAAAASTGGTITITSGNSFGTANAAPINMTAGNAGTTAGNTGVGGVINITAGAGGIAGGNGGAINLTAGASSSSAGGALVLKAGTSTAGVGGAVQLWAADGSSTFNGGATDIRSGSQSGTGNGGTLTVTSGSGGTTSGNGGVLTLSSGASTNGNSGVLNIRTPTAGGTGVGGTMSITAGNGATQGLGGAILIRSGSGAGTSKGGNIALNAGGAINTGNGGDVGISAGSGGGTSGNGGILTLTAGHAPVSGTGGVLRLTAGNAIGGANVGGDIQLYSGGSDANGGNIVLSTGQTGAATYGYVRLQSGITPCFTVVPSGALSIGNSVSAYGTSGQIFTSNGNAAPSWTSTLSLDGSVTATAFTPSGATVPTNGMYSSSANTLNWATNSALRLTLSSIGDLTATGNVTAYSDERLKTNWRDLSSNFVAELANVKVGVYDRTDEVGVTQVGVSAQSLQSVLPNAVLTGDDGMLSVAYGNAALAACIMLARQVEELKAEIKALKG